MLKENKHLIFMIIVLNVLVILFKNQFIESLIQNQVESIKLYYVWTSNTIINIVWLIPHLGFIPLSKLLYSKLCVFNSRYTSRNKYFLKQIMNILTLCYLYALMIGVFNQIIYPHHFFWMSIYYCVFISLFVSITVIISVLLHNYYVTLVYVLSIIIICISIFYEYLTLLFSGTFESMITQSLCFITVIIGLYSYYINCDLLD